MAVLSDYVTGTITLTNGLAAFTGTGTGWLAADFKEGDTIIDITGATEYMGVVATITGEATGTLTKPWEGPTLTNVAYRLRYQPDGTRATAQARQLIEILGNGNITAFASLTGSANKVPMFTGPGAMTLVPKTDLVSGANYNVQVADLAARAAYDAQPGPDGNTPGYAVLVSNVGDGRAAIYSKISDTPGDWSAPGYVTGPQGDASTIPGITWQDDYNPATAYVPNDGVKFNGSSFRNILASTGQAPSSATPPIDNTYWEVLAEKGSDGLPGDGLYNQLEEVAKTADHIVTPTDAGKMLRFNKATPVIGTLPPVAGTDIELYRFLNDGVGSLTIEPDAAETIEGAANLVLATGDAADVWPNAAKTAWRAVVYLAEGGLLKSADNLSDLADPITARVNLGVERETIYSGSLTSIASFSLIDLDVYKTIKISGYARPTVDASPLNLQLGNTAGASWITGGTDYTWSNVYGTGAAAAYNAIADYANFVIGLGSSDGGDLTEGSIFEVTLQRFNKNRETWLIGQAMSYNASGVMVQGTVSGKCRVVSIMDSFKIFYPTGNITELDILVEGIR